MQNKPTVFVTGAGGFIGGRVVETLYFHPDYRLRAGIHTWKGAPRITRFPIEIRRTDIMNLDSLAQAMDGVDAVVHCAYGSPEVTIEGTRNALKVALDKGVRRFVHLSTVEVYGDATGDINETHPYKLTGSAYGDSKIEAEKIAWEYHEKGLSVVVLRPSIVYGPFSTFWTQKVAERILSGSWGTLGRFGEGTCNLVYVDEVVDLIVMALGNDAAVGEAFNANGPDAITWNEYFQRMAQAMGVGPLDDSGQLSSRITSLVMDPTKRVAKWALDRFGDQIMGIYERFDLAKKIMKRTEGAMKTAPSADELKLYSRKMRFCTGKSKNTLGHNSHYHLDATLPLTAKWLKHHGFFSS